jgi:hypothetical protein
MASTRPFGVHTIVTVFIFCQLVSALRLPFSFTRGVSFVHSFVPQNESY